MGFQPDFLWIKCLGTAFSNGLYDSNRGANEYISSNTTGGNVSSYDLMISFDSDGFTTQKDPSSGNIWNYSSDNYVAWSWHANAGTTTTNDASATSVGTIDSVYQANTTAGFSIITYTGSGSTGSIAHGLGAKPAFLIVKQLNETRNWMVFHKSKQDNYFSLNTTGSAQGGYYGSGDDFDSNYTTTTLTWEGGTTEVNKSSGTYVCYAWAEVDGMSKFGKFTSIGNSNGEYIYLGFKPALFVAKSTGTENWIVVDNARPGYNPTGNYVFWNLSNAEGGAGGEYVDLLSNGVKIRTTGASIGSGSTEYIYMAWAEMPQKYSLAR